MQEYIWFRGGVLHCLQVSNRSVLRWPHGLPIYFIDLICFIVPCKNIYGLGVGISTMNKFSNMRGWSWPPLTLPIFHFMCCIVTYKNIYGLGVGILIVYKFLNKRGWGWPPGTSRLFHLICFIVPYIWFRGGDLNCLQDNSTFSNWTGWGWPQVLLFYFIWFVLFSHTRIYMV